MGVNHKNNKYRKIYEDYYGKIPEGFHIHHIDFNPLNNDPKNLIALSPEDHAKIHIEAGHPWRANGKWIQGASEAGKKGGRSYYESLSESERKEWHSNGGKASVNSGGYSMKESGKTNIKNARLKSKKKPCPICEKLEVPFGKGLPMDGGNLKKHMIRYHSGAKVDN